MCGLRLVRHAYARNDNIVGLPPHPKTSLHYVIPRSNECCDAGIKRSENCISHKIKLIRLNLLTKVNTVDIMFKH